MASPAGPAGFAPSPSWLVGPKPHQPGRTPARGWPPWRRAGGRGGGAGGGRGDRARAPPRRAPPLAPGDAEPRRHCGTGRPSRPPGAEERWPETASWVCLEPFFPLGPKKTKEPEALDLGWNGNRPVPLDGPLTRPVRARLHPAPRQKATRLRRLSPHWCRSPQAGRRRVVVGATTRGAGPRDSSGLRRAFTLLLHTAAKKGHARTADSRTAPRRAACARRRLTSPRPGPPGSGP